jgi:GT2 family glycosyltransferase
MTQGRVDSELSVMIPTLGRSILARCLQALLEGETLPAAVLVVDQGRNPATSDLAAEFTHRGLNVEYIPSWQTGRSAGLNQGLRTAKTRFVAITDDDCLPAHDWVAALGARLRAAEDAIVTGRVDAGEGGAVLSVVTARKSVVQRRPSLRFDRLSGGNMGMRRDLFERIGPFEEDPCMRTAEDAEFAYRALRAGVALVYVPEVAVRHLGWRDGAERAEQYWSYARSQGGFYGKYLRRGDVFMVPRILIHLLRSTRRWWVGALRGDVEASSNGRAYVMGLFPGVAAGFRSRYHR